MVCRFGQQMTFNIMLLISLGLLSTYFFQFGNAQNYLLHTVPNIGDLTTWQQRFLDGAVMQPATWSQIPSPAFPFTFFGTEYTTLKVHKHGSVHFNTPVLLERDQCSQKFCDMHIDLSDQNNIVNNDAIYPLNFKSPPFDATYSHTFFGNSTLWIYRTTMSHSTFTTPISYAVALVAPSTVVLLLEPNTANTMLATNTFIGLIANRWKNLVFNPSPINDGTGVQYPLPAAYPPTRIFSYSRDNYKYSQAFMFCAMGPALCAQSYMLQTDRNFSVTNNGDNACFRNHTSKFITRLFEFTEVPSLPIQCVTYIVNSPTGTSNLARYTAATYNQDIDTFECASNGAITGQYIIIDSIVTTSSVVPGPLYQPRLIYTQTNYNNSYQMKANLNYIDYIQPPASHLVRYPVLATPPTDLPFDIDTPLPCHCKFLRFRGQPRANPPNYLPMDYGLKINITEVFVPAIFNTTITQRFFERNDFCYTDCAKSYDGEHTLSPCGQCVLRSEIPIGSDGRLNRTSDYELNCWGMCDTLTTRSIGHFDYLLNQPRKARENGILFPVSPFHELTEDDISPTPLVGQKPRCAVPQYKDQVVNDTNSNNNNNNNDNNQTPFQYLSIHKLASVLSYFTTSLQQEQEHQQHIKPRHNKNYNQNAMLSLDNQYDEQEQQLNEQQQKEESNFSTLATTTTKPNGATTKRDHISTTMSVTDGFKIALTAVSVLGLGFAIYLFIQQKRAEYRRIQRHNERAKRNAARNAPNNNNSSGASNTSNDNNNASAGITNPNNSSVGPEDQDDVPGTLPPAQQPLTQPTSTTRAAATDTSSTPVSPRTSATGGGGRTSGGTTSRTQQRTGGTPSAVSSRSPNGTASSSTRAPRPTRTQPPSGDTSRRPR